MGAINQLPESVMLGGIFSFLGYIITLVVSLWYALTMAFRKGLSIDEQVVIVSIFCLMPFIVQSVLIRFAHTAKIDAIFQAGSGASPRFPAPADC